MKRGTMRALSLLSMVGIGMLVPILGAAFIAGRFLKGHPILMILVIGLGVAVAFRNLFVNVLKELNRKEEKDETIIGRPKGYKDPEE